MPTNPFEPPTEVSDASGPSRSLYFGWLAPVVCWLPALLLVGLAVPTFFEPFGEIEECGKLPTLVSCVFAIARFSRTLLHLPIAVFLIGLIASDVRLADFALHTRVSWLHTDWQVAIGGSGLAAACLIIIGLLQAIV